MLKFQALELYEDMLVDLGGFSKLHSLLHKFFSCLLANTFCEQSFTEFGCLQSHISELFMIQQIHFVSN